MTLALTDYSTSADVFLPDMPAESDISSEALEYEDRKARLREVIASMVDGAPSWDGEPAFVSVEATETAIRFITVMPSNRNLPQVAPDGEGDILFVWEPPYGNCIVTVQDRLLHLVVSPGTRYVEHVDDRPFAGHHIPPDILQAIPAR